MRIEKIGLYDCLIPVLKKRRKPKQVRNDLGGEDSDCRYFGDLIIDNDRLHAEIAKKEVENTTLKDQI